MWMGNKDWLDTSVLALDITPRTALLPFHSALHLTPALHRATTSLTSYQRYIHE